VHGVSKLNVISKSSDELNPNIESVCDTVSASDAKKTETALAPDPSSFEFKVAVKQRYNQHRLEEAANVYWSVTKSVSTVLPEHDPDPGPEPECDLDSDFKAKSYAVVKGVLTEKYTDSTVLTSLPIFLYVLPVNNAKEQMEHYQVKKLTYGEVQRSNEYDTVREDMIKKIYQDLLFRGVHLHDLSDEERDRILELNDLFREKYLSTGEEKVTANCPVVCRESDVVWFPEKCVYCKLRADKYGSTDTVMECEVADMPIVTELPKKPGRVEVHLLTKLSGDQCPILIPSDAYHDFKKKVCSNTPILGEKE